jgi:hypothetical protein
MEVLEVEIITAIKNMYMFKDFTKGEENKSFGIPFPPFFSFPLNCFTTPLGARGGG